MSRAAHFLDKYRFQIEEMVKLRCTDDHIHRVLQFTVRVVHTNNKVDEFVYIHTMYYENGAWQSFAGVPNGKVEAWQPLPEPYKEV